MLQFICSFGASSNFQKLRLILTHKNYQAPDQSSLKKIIQTFRGQDQQTRAQIAFATILKKIHTSDSSDNWIYLLKNLIIFDRVIQQNCFLQQISTLSLRPIENYAEKDQSSKALNSQNILRSFWRLIQFKSSLLCQRSHDNNAKLLTIDKKKLQVQRTASFNKTSSKSHSSNSKTKNQTQKTPNKQNQTKKQTIYDAQRNIISVVRSQKQQFVKTLNAQQLYKQSQQLQNLFEYIFKVTNSIQISKTKHQLKIQSILSSKNSNSNQSQQTKGNQNGIRLDVPISINVLNQNKQQNSNYLYQNLLPKGPTLQKTNTNESANELNQKYKSLREQFFNSKLINYLHLQLLYKLISAYTNQLSCIKAFINLLFQMGNNPVANRFNLPLNSNVNLTKSVTISKISEKEINLWKKLINTYLDYCDKIINYVQRHKHIKGFEIINYYELSPFQNLDILSILEDYINHQNTLQQPDIVKIEDLGNVIQNDSNRIKVEKKSQWSYQKALTARKMVLPARNLVGNNSFINWQNSYSSNFPPKQILTLDLLMQIRQNPDNSAISYNEQDQQEKSIYQPFAVNRHSCIYNFRQSNISTKSQLQFIPPHVLKKKQQEQLQSQISKKTKSIYYFKVMDSATQFKNIYSSLTSQSVQWIQ